MTDSPNSLSVYLRANYDQLAQDFQAVGRLAEDKVSSIEQAFQNLNPGIDTNALATGIGGVLGVAGIDKFVQKVVEANKSLSDMLDLARQLGISLSELQDIKFAANVGGVSDDKFSKDIVGLRDAYQEAQKGEGDLAKLLDANNIKYKESEGHVLTISQLLKTVGDLIKNANSYQDQNKIAELASLSKEWVKALEDGGDAFIKIGEGAKSAGAKIDDATIEKAAEFTKEWNAAAAAWASGMKAAAGDILPYIDKLVKGAVTVVQTISGITGGALAGGRALLDSLKYDDDNRLSISDEAAKSMPLDALQNYINVISRIPGVTQDVENAIESDVARLQSILDQRKKNGEGQATTALTVKPKPDHPTKLPPDDDDDDKANAFTRVEDQLTKRIALYGAETASIGQNTQAKQTAKAEAELLTAANKAGLDVDDDLKKKIDELATKYGEAAQAAENAKVRFQGIADATRFFGDQMSTSIDNLVNKTQNLGQVMQTVLQQITSNLLKAALTGEGAFAKLLGFASTTGGTGGLFGLIGGLFPGKAGGGDVSGGMPYIVGEKGPELFMPGVSGAIIPNDVLRGASAMGGGGSISMPISIDARGSTPDAAQAIAAAIEAKVTAKIIPAVREAVSRGVV